MELTNDFVNRHFVYDDRQRFLGYVQSGSFASDAWINFYEFLTFEGQVDVLWADNNKVNCMGHKCLRRIPTVEKLWELINSGKYVITPEFRSWISGDSSVEATPFNLFKISL